MENPFSKEEKLFSVIAPCYGVTYQHLPQWVDALSNQDYKTFEAIVVFDGPHKKGVKMMDKLIKEYPDLNMRYYVAEHGGACAARNFGATKAKGELLAFPSPDCYLYPEALRLWATEFEDPTVNRVWGHYDLIDEEGNVKHSIGNAPLKGGEVWYPAFKFSPYADATFPCRASDFIGWDENCKSLQDWEFSLRMLKRDNYEGKDWRYIPMSMFAAELPKKGGLSDDSHTHWLERSTYVKSKNGIKNNDIVVASLGAPHHAMNTSVLLDADFQPMPSFKPHEYKMVYLLGFYTKEGNPPIVTQQHMKTFERSKGVNVIHWIGSDIMQLRWNCSFEKIKALKKFFKENNIIHLAEADFTQKELAEVGIKSKVVPIPPEKLYSPIELPEKFTVGIYAPNSELYNEDLMMEIVRSMPDVQFYFFGDKNKKGKGDNWEHLGYIDYDEWMPKFSCNLRVTAHDGLPLTCLQFMSAGRSVVTNVPLKGAIQVEKDRDSIIKGVRQAQKHPLNAEVAKYWIKELDTKKFIKSIRGLI